MGWTGHYLGYNPKGQARIDQAIIQEGYEYKERDRESHVIDASMRGNTIYLAVNYTDNTGRNEVYGAVILTGYGDGFFDTKGISENMGPCECDCPKRIINKLTPTDNEYALDWRRRCMTKA